MNKDEKKLNSEKIKFIVVITICSICVCIIPFMLFKSVRDVCKKGVDTMSGAFITSSQKTSRDIEKKVFDIVENKYHVSNDVKISVDKMEETKKLEVLRVHDIEYIIENNTDNDDNVTSWLEVPGEGVFTVDLTGAEYIVDDKRNYIKVRVPHPSLEHVNIVYENVNELLFTVDGFFNGTHKAGEDLARKHLDNAYMLITREFTSNQSYFMSAENAAVSSIEFLLKEINPDVEDLQVEVEFFDS